ncbi:Ankyrin_repeat-containing domain superfamily [Hexamita inflata]|uniref:Ankyrin repeat-containing domain superfamily n=1 Tax=Hexamita inflata TaxID=28002 RepID=A0AA86R0X6_9EUKA|nr:Ankyrin repeat-containing domain superfamily [Hexamita inflata]
MLVVTNLIQQIRLPPQMGCTIEIQNTKPINREWFQAAIDNDIHKIQSLKQECLSTFHNGLCALHYAIIYNSLDVFVELLPEEGLLATNSDISLLNKVFTSRSNILELSVICDNFKLTQLILDFFEELSKSYDLVSADPLFWCLNNLKQNCMPLLSHPFFKKQIERVVSEESNILNAVRNEALFKYLYFNFSQLSKQFRMLLNHYYISNYQQIAESGFKAKLQKKVEQEHGMLISKLLHEADNSVVFIDDY